MKDYFKRIADDELSLRLEAFGAVQIKGPKWCGKTTTAEQQAMKDSGIEQIRYCLIVISTVPVLAMYAVVQKYFQKGVMVGSVKG